jgi:hypothetical protein
MSSIITRIKAPERFKRFSMQRQGLLNTPFRNTITPEIRWHNILIGLIVDIGRNVWVCIKIYKCI